MSTDTYTLPPRAQRATIKFPRKRALSILYRGDDAYKIVRNTLEDSTRWSLCYDLVIQNTADSRFWNAGYRQGATESQDEGPWEGDTEVTFTEVFPVEKVVIEYC